MKYISSIFLLLFICVAISLTSCGDEEFPSTATIKGTVTIENINTWNTWRDSGEVQLTIFPEFSLNPAAGWGMIPDGTFGPGVPGGTYAIGAPFNSQDPIVFTYEPGKTEYPYELVVDPGTYSALALGFRHDFVNDPSRKTATLGVHFDNPSEVSHGVVIRVDFGGGNIQPILSYPAPTTITVAAGDEKTINFKADFNFVNIWYM